MPTYEYVCENCGHHFELFQSMSAEPVKVCPKCGKMSVKRLIGGGNGFLFKGSGFYITDYRSQSYQSAKRSEGGVSTAPSTSSDKKVEKTVSNS